MRFEINWRWFYAAIGLLLFSVISPLYWEYGRLNNESDWLRIKDVPTLTGPEIGQNIDALDRDLKRPASADPQEYFKFLARINRVPLLFEKYERSGKPEIDTGRFFRLRNRVNTLKNIWVPDLYQKYRERHGLAVMQKAGDAYYGGGNHKLYEYEAADYGNLIPLFRLAYLQSLPLAFVFFLLWLRGKGLRIPIETWRTAMATIFWPITIFLYPTRINPKKQLAAAIRFAAFLITTALSFGSMGGIAKAQTGKSGKKRSADNAEAFKANANVELMPLSTNGSYGQIVSPNYGWEVTTRYGKFSGGGFVETGNVPLFTNHRANYTPPLKRLSFFSFASEQGGNSKHPFMQLGGKLQLTRAPAIGKTLGKIFNNLSVGQFSRVAGVHVPQETLIVWGTKELPLGRGLRLSASGFYRARGGHRPDFGEPELWVRLKPWKHLFLGMNAELAGGALTPRFGLNYVF